MNVLLDERVLRKGSEVKDAFIQGRRPVWPISVQCRVLGVSVAGDHAHCVRRASRVCEVRQRRHLSDDALIPRLCNLTTCLRRS